MENVSYKYPFPRAHIKVRGYVPGDIRCRAENLRRQLIDRLPRGAHVWGLSPLWYDMAVGCLSMTVSVTLGPEEDAAKQVVGELAATL